MAYGQNTTINIKNAPWMNLAQMGMGMLCGGGYNSYSPMGMGGSIFSMGGYGMGCGSFGSLTGLGYGMGGYGMGMNMMGIGGYGCCDISMGTSDILAMIATNAFGVAMMAIGQEGGGGSRAPKAPKLTNEERINNIETNAKEYLNVLNKGSDIIYSFEDISSNDNNDIKNTLLSDCRNAIQSANGAIDAEIANLDSQISNIGELGTRPTEVGEEQTTWDTKKAELDQLKERKAKLEAKTDNSEPLIKKYLEAKEAEKAREAEINKALKALQELKAKKEKLENAEEGQDLQKILKKADGNGISRMIGGNRDIQKALSNFAKAQKKFMNGKGNKDDVKLAYNTLANLNDGQPNGTNYYYSKDTQFADLFDRATSWCKQNGIIE